MFRGCYFEFAGKSSEIYDLKLFYINNDQNKFKSGGEFEMKTDSLPYFHQQLFYGKDYSQSPLEFEIEISVTEGSIPFKKMMEIKNWLFGQDKWQDFSFTDGTQNYHLKCILEPVEDITDVSGYKGVRCVLHNASPFWYGDEKEIEFTRSDLLANTNKVFETYNGWIEYSVVNIFIPDNDYAENNFCPIIIFDDKRCDYGGSITDEDVLDNNCGIALVDVETVAEGMASTEQMVSGQTLNLFDIKNSKSMWFSTPYLSTNDWGSTNKDIVELNTQFATVESLSSDNIPNIYVQNHYILPPFSLKTGNNICRIRHPRYYDKITVKYTPLYRMGAF